MGIFCPCLGTVEFDITGTNGQLTDGRISKIFGGCGEIMAGANNFRVRFPTGANPVEKMALIGALSFLLRCVVSRCDGLTERVVVAQGARC